MRDQQTPIDKAVRELEAAINDMTVKVDNVYKAFCTVHPYLLNIIAKGIMKTIAYRSGDMRINPYIAKAASELFPEEVIR